MGRVGEPLLKGKTQQPTDSISSQVRCNRDWKPKGIVYRRGKDCSTGQGWREGNKSNFTISSAPFRRFWQELTAKTAISPSGESHHVKPTTRLVIKSQLLFW